MPDYQQGKIYKLWSPSKNLVYYGSTTQTLAQRLTDHKRKCEVRTCCSYLIIECEDYKIELLEEYPCNNKTQLEKKEGEYQKANECINKNIAGRTKKEYDQDNKEKKAEYDKKRTKYRETNKEKKAEYDKQRYELKKQNNIAKE